MDLNEFKNLVFTSGEQAGLSDMEIYVARSKNLQIKIYQEDVDDYSLSVEQGVGFRARYGDKVGYAYVETLDQDSVDFLVSGAKANAQIIDSKDEIVFFAGSDNYPEFEAFSEQLANLSPTEKIEFAKDLESHAFAADERVSMVNWAATGYSEGEVYIANTKGLEHSFKNNGAYGLVSAVIKGDEQVKTGSRFIFGTDWSKFNAKKLAEEAVKEGASLLGSSTIKSDDYRVLLRYDVARELLGTFASVFSADNVQKGLSLLANKLGENIASPLVTLVDDPLLPNGGSSAPFDGEGVATKTKNVIERGKLTTYLHNLKTAKKDGVESTGNASRPSFKSTVGIAPSNFFIRPGEKDYPELIKELGDGLIIISVQGTHSGADSVSGDFSLGAYGYLVENGEIVRPVDQITIAGNFFKLLEDIEIVGSDLDFDIPGAFGNMGSPSLIIRNLAVAGD